MEKEFIPYEQAVELKELGFDEPCLGYYLTNLLTNEVKLFIDNRTGFSSFEKTTPAPTFSQAFRFFRDKYDLFISIVHYNNGYAINHLRRFETYEEAELECLKKLIEIIKDK